ncbi:SDR family NAD(P)-dependent oxidoreductase [Nocardia sp. JMUB6875]|uniref:SDR family NAD(P)-dependent oxidoreductase n=1 Tax=Nocardia sp. JMUB6875 TaxID=3158170 RepID=UPI0034E8635E
MTGAATGIGRSIAETLAAQGIRVGINHPHTPDLADEVVAKIEANWVTAQNIRVNGSTA